MITDLLLLLPACIALLCVIVWRRTRGRADVPTGIPQGAIVVDGSNVMHWGGDPSETVLRRVIDRLGDMGHTPIVFFDANVGYKLGDHYYDEARLAGMLQIPEKHILVAHKGMEADEWILDFAQKHGLRIVSNDRFRDRRVQFPFAAKKGRVLRGTYRDGAVVWANRN